ncbi:hypothetical protein BH11PLA1_BH11PLA1_15860 [soil metagenome]
MTMNDPLHPDHGEKNAPSARDMFLLIVDAPAADHARLLAQLCGANPDLRRAVEALLAARRAASAASFMQHPTNPAFEEPPTGDSAAARSGASTAVTPATPLSEHAGTRIGPYKLLQQIGEGGFGAVFMADQESPVRRRVALKIIKLGMDTRQVVARFDQEKHALALMSHPHIAKVLDAGATDTGRPYFVMEYVAGDPITHFADAHKLSVRQRLELFAQVCAAVQHAHTKGVIHRDLKPGNVLVTMTDGKPFAKVIDFGIAKATGGAGGRLTDASFFTEHRQLIGTPEYMSPEQAAGSPDIDTRTDVYALGVMLYELLAGEPPFTSARLRSAAYVEMQRIIKEEEPPAPSLRFSRELKSQAATAAARQSDPAKLGAVIKGELDWIVLKALEKERARRYETPNQLALDVERHLRGEAVLAAPASVGYRVRKFVRRNKGIVGAIATVSAALLIALTTFAVMAVLLNSKATEAATAREAALAHAREAIAARTSLERAELAARQERDAALRDSYRANLASAQSLLQLKEWDAARAALDRCPPALRHVEWDYINAMSDDSLTTVTLLETQVVLCLAEDAKTAFVYDHDRLAVAAIRPSDGTTIGAIPIQGKIKGRTCTPDGARLVVMTSLYLYVLEFQPTRIVFQRSVTKPDAPDFLGTNVMISADGTRIGVSAYVASGAAAPPGPLPGADPKPNATVVLDLQTGAEYRLGDPDVRMLNRNGAIALSDGRVPLLRVDSGEGFGEKPTDTRWNCLRASRDTAICSGSDPGLYELSLQTGKIIATHSCPGVNWQHILRVSDSDDVVYTSDTGVWFGSLPNSFASAKKPELIAQGGMNAFYLEVDWQSRRIVSCDRAIKTWAAHRRSDLNRLGWEDLMAAAPDGSTLLQNRSADLADPARSRAVLLDPSSGEIHGAWTLTSPFRAAAYSPDGNSALFFHGHTATLHRLNDPQGEGKSLELAGMEDRPASFFSIGFTPDGSFGYVVRRTFSDPSTLCTFSIPDMQLIDRFDGLQHGSDAVLPINGETLLVSSDGFLRRANGSDGTLLPGPDNVSFSSLTLNPQAEQVAILSGAGVEIRTLPSLDVLTSFELPGEWFYISWVDNGARLWVAGIDLVSLLDSATGDRLFSSSIGSALRPGEGKGPLLGTQAQHYRAPLRDRLAGIERAIALDARIQAAIEGADILPPRSDEIVRALNLPVTPAALATVDRWIYEFGDQYSSGWRSSGERLWSGVSAGPITEPADSSEYLKWARGASRSAPDAAAITRTLGVALYRAGNYREAIAALTRADTQYARSNPLQPSPDLPQNPVNWICIAMAHAQLGDAPAARAALATALRLSAESQPPNPEDAVFRAEAETLFQRLGIPIK